MVGCFGKKTQQQVAVREEVKCSPLEISVLKMSVMGVQVYDLEVLEGLNLQQFFDYVPATPFDDEEDDISRLIWIKKEFNTQQRAIKAVSPVEELIPNPSISRNVDDRFVQNREMIPSQDVCIAREMPQAQRKVVREHRVLDHHDAEVDIAESEISYSFFGKETAAPVPVSSNSGLPRFHSQNQNEFKSIQARTIRSTQDAPGVVMRDDSIPVRNGVVSSIPGTAGARYVPRYNNYVVRGNCKITDRIGVNENMTVETLLVSGNNCPPERMIPSWLRESDRVKNGAQEAGVVYRDVTPVQRNNVESIEHYMPARAPARIPEPQILGNYRVVAHVDADYELVEAIPVSAREFQEHECAAESFSVSSEKSVEFSRQNEKMKAAHSAYFHPLRHSVKKIAKSADTIDLDASDCDVDSTNEETEFASSGDEFIAGFVANVQSHGVRKGPSGIVAASRGRDFRGVCV